MVTRLMVMMVMVTTETLISSRCLRYILPSLLAALVVNGSRYFVIMIIILNIMIMMIRFFETETASICLDFTECGPCYETATWA